MKKIFIIGGGAAGMMAALAAAGEGRQVTILERTSQLGKKILVTGNGKCNLTNLIQDPAGYHCGTETFPFSVLTNFDHQQTIRFFSKLGIYTDNKNDYIYPNSGQAASVVDVLKMEIEHKKIKLKFNQKIERIEKQVDVFQIHTDGWSYQADAVVLAAGSLAAPATGSDGSGYALAAQLGHTVLTPLPALVPLIVIDKRIQKLAGVRVKGSVTLYIDGRPAVTEAGELQFTENTLSGIPVFQLSRYAAKAQAAGRKVTAACDFLPAFPNQVLTGFLKKRADDCPYKAASKFLTGMFPEKLAAVLLEQAGLPGTKECGRLTGQELGALAGQIKGLIFSVDRTAGFDRAQVCTGGVNVDEVDETTLESKQHSGLYFAGEILDVDGACGGYNLQWAWSSGYIAGRAAAGVRRNINA